MEQERLPGDVPKAATRVPSGTPIWQKPMSVLLLPNLIKDGKSVEEVSDDIIVVKKFCVMRDGAKGIGYLVLLF